MKVFSYENINSRQFFFIIYKQESKCCITGVASPHPLLAKLLCSDFGDFGRLDCNLGYVGKVEFFFSLKKSSKRFGNKKKATNSKPSDHDLYVQ